MNEPTLTQLKITPLQMIQLKIIVERAVRPVRASTARKRKMREELLAHVSGVFEEELARLGEESAALKQTELRFGNPAEVTSQLQESVPARDVIRRFWEGRPDESALRSALRIAWATVALVLVVFVVAEVKGRWGSAWSREARLLYLDVAITLPAFLVGFSILTVAMEKALDSAKKYSAQGPSRKKVALIAAASWLLMMLWLVGLTWRTWPTEWDYLSGVLFALWTAPAGLLFPYALAQSATLRRRYHEEWSRLPIEPSS